MSSTFMTYYDKIWKRKTKQYSTNKRETKYLQWVYTYQESFREVIIDNLHSNSFLMLCILEAKLLWFIILLPYRRNKLELNIFLFLKWAYSKVDDVSVRKFRSKYPEIMVGLIPLDRVNLAILLCLSHIRTASSSLRSLEIWQRRHSIFLYLPKLSLI